MISRTNILRKNKLSNSGLIKENENNIESAQHLSTAQDNSPILHLVSKKIPMTSEMRRRKYAEQLREKYSIKRENKGYFL